MVIAIEGRSASGKSTLGRQLAGRPDVALVEMDDFYRVDDQVARASYSPEDGVDRYFDWQRLRDEALVPLSEGRVATFRVYDWDNNADGDFKVVGPRPFVVIEGVYSARPDTRSIVDLVVMVDTPREVAAARQMGRGQSATQWIARWRAAENYYFDHVLDDAAIDLRVSGGVCCRSG